MLSKKLFFSFKKTHGIKKKEEKQDNFAIQKYLLYNEWVWKRKKKENKTNVMLMMTRIQIRVSL